MTMPHLMNCSHSETGWCLECVKELNADFETAETESRRMRAERDELQEMVEELLSLTPVEFAICKTSGDVLPPDVTIAARQRINTKCRC